MRQSASDGLQVLENLDERVSQKQSDEEECQCIYDEDVSLETNDLEVYKDEN